MVHSLNQKWGVEMCQELTPPWKHDHTIPVLDTWSLGLKGWASIKSVAMSENFTTALGKCHISSTGETVAGKCFPVSDSGDRVKPWVWGTPVRSSYTRLNLSKRYNVFESSLSSSYLTRVQLKFKEKQGKAIWRNNWLTQTKIKFTFYHLISSMNLRVLKYRVTEVILIIRLNIKFLITALPWLIPAYSRGWQ